MTTAVNRPSPAPMSGALDEPSPELAACVAAHRNRAVSRPSRPTASIATTTREAREASAARSTWLFRSPDRLRAERAIQKIIQVTKPTATMDSVPPIASWASNVRPRGPYVRAAPKAREIAMAAATPSQMRPSRWRRPDFTR